MISGKVWGQTQVLLKTPFIEVHKLIVVPNMHCSMHKHQFKWNAFVVIAGKLFIETIKDYGLTDVTELNPEDFTTVKPNELHRFVTRDLPCIALEIYYSEPLSEDIIRRDAGGINSTHNNLIGVDTPADLEAVRKILR